MINLISKLFSSNKTKFNAPTKPEWQETVRLMRDRSLDCFTDKVFKVVFSKDGEHRFILFESNKGYFYYIVEHLTEFDDEEWCYVSQTPNALPAMWLPDGGAKQHSVFGQETEAWNDFISSSEYNQYFFDVSE